eukprot:CAMPEP_0185570746 /NCGR_PEP_ID=MMETSP0434-20130131/2944_1 /TAXON_ID=626734 ORGANISM="Favella taraikaensis, Strain Fe Narragansett Bay" /NCGR_SAMPLE_ID=MMETSP0434 /ASSEMBLY_ACC=CAM_ASM_000379 /LENGTH=169 /DNA_ID=CAMNT_0028185947 /DNA_START=53 /DNA_END=562 /DNA_ORIENTATION=+
MSVIGDIVEHTDAVVADLFDLVLINVIDLAPAGVAEAFQALNEARVGRRDRHLDATRAHHAASWRVGDRVGLRGGSRGVDEKFHFVHRKAQDLNSIFIVLGILSKVVDSQRVVAFGRGSAPKSARAAIVSPVDRNWIVLVHWRATEPSRLSGRLLPVLVQGSELNTDFL